MPGRINIGRLPVIESESRLRALAPQTIEDR